mmetsp:Transcript_18670/g.51089  ORF Transcript_18670/g.51089 Transcript_18670/m.51089 type:complete len:295 (+) Transcript_18670:30-914(+)
MVALKTSSSFLALIAAVLLCGESDGFALSNIRVERRPRDSGSTPRRSSRARSFDALKATEQLVFGGDYCGISDPLPVGTSKEAAEEFMMRETTQNLLFSAGGKNPSEPLAITEELVEMWSNLTEYYGYDRKPTLDDKMVKVTSSVKFPGLTLTTISASGLFVLDNPNSGLKEYHSFFVAEEQQVTGLPPSVFVYNRLTGNSEKEKGKFYPGSGKALSIVSVVEKNDGALSYSFDVKLQITVNFPRALMKILPMSKEKMEEQAGKSISKTISKDVDSAMEAVAKAYEVYESAPTS